MENGVKEHYDKLSYLGGPRTPIRVAILEELYANGPLRKSKLKKLFVKGKARKDKEGKKEWGFEVSKPTLYRQFDNSPEENTGESQSLVERGWVKDVSESRGAEAKYAITPKGRLVYEEVASLLSTFDLVADLPSDLEPFLEIVTKADVEMDEEVLRDLPDSEIYTKSPTGLDETTMKGIQFVSEDSYHRGISWIASEDFVDYYNMFLEDRNNEAEFIFTQEVLDGLVENHTEKWREMLETENLTLFEYDVFPLGMTIVEHGVAWGYFESPHGTHKAELVTESDTVREWAIDVFKEYKQKGDNVTEAQLEKTREKKEKA